MVAVRRLAESITEEDDDLILAMTGIIRQQPRNKFRSSHTPAIFYYTSYQDTVLNDA